MRTRPSRHPNPCAPRRHRGFTVLETAISLVLVALLLAATLAIDALLEQSRAKEFAREAAALASSIHLYRERYGALPGDDPAASRRWPGVASGNGNGTLGGRYDQTAPSQTDALANGAEDNESLLAWWHLRRAGFLTGATEGTSAVAAARLGTSAGPLGLQSGAFGMSGTVACLGGATAATAESIDRNLDDGSPHTGSVRAGASVAQPASGYTHGERYALCVSLEGRSGPSVLALAQADAPPAAAGTGASPAPGSSSGGTDGTQPTAVADQGGSTDGSGSSDWGGWRGWYDGLRERCSHWWGRG